MNITLADTRPTLEQKCAVHLHYHPPGLVPKINQLGNHSLNSCEKISVVVIYDVRALATFVCQNVCCLKCSDARSTTASGSLRTREFAGCRHSRRGGWMPQAAARGATIDFGRRRWRSSAGDGGCGCLGCRGGGGVGTAAAAVAAAGGWATSRRREPGRLARAASGGWGLYIYSQCADSVPDQRSAREGV